MESGATEDTLQASLKVYRDAVTTAQSKLGRSAESLDAPHLRAWQKAYEESGHPLGRIGPKQGQALLDRYNYYALTEIKKLCERSVKAELFFAARILNIQAKVGAGTSPAWRAQSRSSPNVELAVASVRRLMSDAALVYADLRHRTYGSYYAGDTKEAERGSFGETLLVLLRLTNRYIDHQTRYVWLGLGCEAEVSEEGLYPVHDQWPEFRELTSSADARRKTYYNPVARSGEFAIETHPRHRYVNSYFREFGRTAADSSGLLAALPERDEQGLSCYSLIEWPLQPLQMLLHEYPAETLLHTLRLGADELCSFLHALNSLVREKLANENQLYDARACALVLLPQIEVEGRVLVERARTYLRQRGLEADWEVLESAREKFLYLACSEGKTGRDPIFLQVQPGTRRYGYLLHRFGTTYVLDLLGADHWQSRLLDLIAQRIGKGKPANDKGLRVESRIMEHLTESARVEPVTELRRFNLEKKKGEREGDVDCAVRVEDTLILVEVKGHRLHYEVDDARHRYVKERWDGCVQYLKEADNLVQDLASRDDPRLRSALRGIRRIVGVVCRPFPEWIPTLDTFYWLRPPGRDDPQRKHGVPRILAPGELRDWLESVTKEELSALPSRYTATAKST